jgi:hypothetical protein
MSVNVNGIVTRLESVRRDIKKLNLSESNTHTTNSGRMDQSDHAFPEVASPEQNDQHYEPASLSSEVPSRVDTSALTPISAVHMCAVCGNTGHLAVACALTLRARQPEISQTRPVQDAASVEERTAPMDQIGLGQQYSSHPALRPKEPPMFQGRVEDNATDWTRSIVTYFQLSNISASESQQILYASQFLSGDAREWHCFRLIERRTLPQETLLEWLFALETTFANVVNPYQLRVAFFACQQGNRSLAEYVRDIQRRYRAAISAGNEMGRLCLRDVFSNGLSDQRLKREVHAMLSEKWDMTPEEVMRAVLIKATTMQFLYGSTQQQSAYPTAQFVPERGQALCFTCKNPGHQSRNCNLRKGQPMARPLALHVAAVSEEEQHPEPRPVPVLMQTESIYHLIARVGGCTHCKQTYAQCGHVREDCTEVQRQLN